MELDELISKHPQLFHMAEAGAWTGIQRHGLLSTTALLDLFGVSGPERSAIESQRRPHNAQISHPVHGAATIRDNKPLREDHLINCLEDMTPTQWYETLNRKTFFWVRPEKLDVLLNARAYRKRSHDVLTVDTQQLLTAHRDQTSLAPINTGSTLYPKATRRGTKTFVPIANYDWDAMRRWRRLDAITELTVDYAVPDIAQFVVKVERRHPDGTIELLADRTSL